eukprot:30067-Pelagococcus_subviridis.AAC.5
MFASKNSAIDADATDARRARTSSAMRAPSDAMRRRRAASLVMSRASSLERSVRALPARARMAASRPPIKKRKTDARANAPTWRFCSYCTIVFDVLSYSTPDHERHTTANISASLGIC